MSPKHFYRTSLFAQRLKHYREHANITRSEMAKHLKITPTAYGAYELGNREPKLSALCDIANILNVSTDELLGNIYQEEQESIQFIQNGDFKITSTDGKYTITDNRCPTTSFTLTLDELRQCVEKVKSSQLYTLSLKEWLIDSISHVIFSRNVRKGLTAQKKDFTNEEYAKLEKNIDDYLSSDNAMTIAITHLNTKDMTKLIDTAYKKALNIKDDDTDTKKAPDNT